jgi:hypothetical protein
MLMSVRRANWWDASEPGFEDVGKAKDIGGFGVNDMIERNRACACVSRLCGVQKARATDTLSHLGQ